MRDHSRHIEVSRQQAMELLLGSIAFKPEVETIPIDQAFGRVLAQDALAQQDMPNCLTCDMDSVAIHWDDFKDGMPDTTGWQRGVQWQFANTGIGMPEGFDTAIVIENVELGPDYQTISFKALPSKQYAGTSPAGNRMHKNDVLVKAGSILTPLLVSYIAQGNNAQVNVYAKPKVAFIPTGGELMVVGSNLGRGKNLETNSLVARGKIEQWGGECIVWDIVPDSPELIKQAVAQAAKTCDIVVLNAGSSKGSDDWNIEMLEEMGTVLYHETNHGPGHHSSGAIVEGVPVVGISGPPGGAAFTMDFYLYPVMRKYFGLPCELPTKRVQLAQDFPSKKKKFEEAAEKKADDKTNTAKTGETRPDIVSDGRIFYAVKQLQFVQDEESAALQAMPAATSHPGPVEAETLDCYFLLDKNDSPHAGDIIEVQLRP